MIALLKRELSSYFTSPIGYIYLSVFYIFAGFIFVMGVIASSQADLSPVFSFLFTILILLVPILTMRLFSEEKKQKTDQLLLTSPISILGIVLAKFLAAFVLFTIGISIIAVFALIVAAFADPNWSMVLGNLLGLFLLGAALISVGMFISSLTESQVAAAVGSFAFMLFLLLIDSVASFIPIQFIANFLSKLSFYTKYADFTSGIINYANILFFLSFAAIFIFLTLRVLEKKRWS